MHRSAEDRSGSLPRAAAPRPVVPRPDFPAPAAARAIAQCLLVLTITLCGLLSALPVQAEIFQYVDKNGNVYLTNRRDVSPQRKLVRTWHEMVGGGGARAGKGGGGHSMGMARSDRGVTVDFSRYRVNKARFAPVIDKISNRFRLPPALIHAVIEAESAYNPAAVSSAGAVGLMQLIKGTAARFGVTDRTDPVANIYAGTKYLRWLLGVFNNNLILALAGYNAGEGAVIQHGYKVPPYQETREYVRRVLLFYRKHRVEFPPIAEGGTKGSG